MRRLRWFAALLMMAALSACYSVPPPPPPAPAAITPPFVEVGVASWYGPGFAQKRTADGERFALNGLTAAHRTLPLNTYVRVTNLDNGRGVIVRINDRGPYYAGRIIDLSPRAARALGMKENGLARVRIEEVPEAEARM